MRPRWRPKTRPPPRQSRSPKLTKPAPPAAQQQQEAQAEPPGSSQEESTAPVEADTSDAAEPEQDITQEVEQEEAVAQSGPSEAAATELEPTDSGASRAQVDPTVSEEPFTTASVDGAELIAERITAEAVPAGIPRTLGDGEAYDATRSDGRLHSVVAGGDDIAPDPAAGCDAPER